MKGTENISENILEEMPQKGECAVIANTIFKLLKNKKITLKEYLERCAYWGVKTLDDIYFRSLPSKSLEIIEYEQLPNYKRHQLTWEYYINNPGVMRYYEERDKIIRINKTNFWRLETYKLYIPESDIENHEKLDKKIMDFKIKMNSY